MKGMFERILGWMRNVGSYVIGIPTCVALFATGFASAIALAMYRLVVGLFMSILATVTYLCVDDSEKEETMEVFSELILICLGVNKECKVAGYDEGSFVRIQGEEK